MSKCIRVLQYIGGLGTFGGSQAFVMEMYRKLDRNKVQFDFVVFPGTQGGYVPEAIELGANIYECPKYDVKNHKQFCHWWNNFLNDHSEYKVVHGHVRSCASVYIPICKKHGCVTIIHSHSTSNGNGLDALVKYLMQLPIRRQADYLFSCSDIAGEWLYGRNAISQDNYRMIPNCIDLNRFSFDCMKRKEIREELGIKDNEFVIGHIGRFCEAKNHEFIIKVFNDITKKNSDSKLLLIGDGELKVSIEKLVCSLDIRNRVIFSGNVSNPEQYYQAMDCFFFPSKWEGLPVSVVEAQASGLTCLISDTITKDVVLTDLVHQYPIENVGMWVKAILNYKDGERKQIDSDQKKRLCRFDSQSVAKDLQEFYLSMY